jgi:AcrR family transcriptional regulator
MARPRFAKLSPAQQRTILDAALAEFAAHGFAGASLNRIIEASGISKGSMYYYFDDKEDLYGHVIRDSLEGLLQRVDPIDLTTTTDPANYWATLTEGYLALMRALTGSPEVAALLRGWVAGGAAPAMGSSLRDAERELVPWVVAALARGQEIGAVRTDLPTELLLSVVLAMGQAVDIWMITAAPADPEAAGAAVIDMMRRAVAP